MPTRKKVDLRSTYPSLRKNRIKNRLTLSNMPKNQSVFCLYSFPAAYLFFK